MEGTYIVYTYIDESDFLYRKSLIPLCRSQNWHSNTRCGDMHSSGSGWGSITRQIRKYIFRLANHVRIHLNIK